MKILIGADVPPDPNAGASGTVYQMAEGLRRIGHEVDTFWSNDMGRKIQHGNLHYILELPRNYRRFVKKHVSLKSYDVIELNQPHAYLAAEYLQRRKFGGIFVNRSHGHEVRSEEALAPWRLKFGQISSRGIKRSISNFLQRILQSHWERVTKAADGFVVSCSQDRDFIQGRYGVPSSRIGLITQGVSNPFLKTQIPPSDNSRFLRWLYVGQLAFFKAPHILAEVVTDSLQRIPTATFTWICGISHHAEASNLFPESIRSRVHFVDWMPQEKLISFIDQHGLFLFPSYFEGFGKAPLEAMSRGLAVVASDEGGMRDFIQHDVNGLKVPVGEVAGFTRAVERIVADFEFASRLSQNARATALQHSWDRCARDCTLFYEHLLAMKKQS